MDVNELRQFIEDVDNWLISKYDNDKDPQKRVFTRTIKLNEEVGELCSAILAKHSIQRDEKLAEQDKLQEEFADVLITTLLLARASGVDISKALKSKVDKVSNRIK